MAISDDYATAAIYGDTPNNSQIPADMLNSGAAGDETDWGAVLAGGIRGAAQAAISASVGAKFADGQLVTASTATARAKAAQARTWLVIAVVAYLALR